MRQKKRTRHLVVGALRLLCLAVKEWPVIGAGLDTETEMIIKT
jgi:hypothetical protein